MGNTPNQWHESEYENKQKQTNTKQWTPRKAHAPSTKPDMNYFIWQRWHKEGYIILKNISIKTVNNNNNNITVEAVEDVSGMNSPYGNKTTSRPDTLLPCLLSSPWFLFRFPYDSCPPPSHSSVHHPQVIRGVVYSGQPYPCATWPLPVLAFSRNPQYHFPPMLCATVNTTIATLKHQTGDVPRISR